jgi:D-tyrosyl-tRNA(Tyr) deacylase
LRAKSIHVETGQFQEMMDVYLINDGPVTLMLDSEKNF